MNIWGMIFSFSVPGIFLGVLVGMELNEQEHKKRALKRNGAREAQRKLYIHSISDPTSTVK